MSWLFGAEKSKQNEVYALLEQDQSSDDGFSDGSDEEDVIFRNTDQLHHKHYPKARSGNARRLSKFYCRSMCICLAIVLVLVSAVVVAVIVVKNDLGGQDESDKDVPPNVAESGHLPVANMSRPYVNQSDLGEWTTKLENYGGEGAIAVLDVDGDDIDDIVLAGKNGLLFSIMMDNYSPKFSALREACEKEGLTYPCYGEVVAVKGTNGKVLWRLPIRSESFVIMCDIDIDKDGRKDCISTGRHATAVAYDPYTPKVFWTAEDDNFMKAHWNMYRAVILPDWNSDGVPEVLLTHGGNPAKNKTDHDRESGRLIVVSGATGTPMGVQYLAMPNSKETYMSSVIYRPTDTSTDYILFGSGGETVPGDLMAISMYDFCVYIMGESESSVCTKTGDQDVWPGAEKSDIGIITLIRGQKKGVVVPPIVVDMDKDGYMDLVVSVFEGSLVLINGKTLKVVWKVEFPGMESYSTPAPGYFDDDDVLDFMVHWCIGEWNDYLGTNTYIISGAKGEIIWTLFSPVSRISSGIVVNQQRANQDLFLFRLQGRGSGFRWNEDGVISRPENSTRKRRHGKPEIHEHSQSVHGGSNSTNYTLEEEYKRHFLVCEENLSHFTDEIFLMDKTMVTEPLLVLEIPTETMKYNTSNEDRESDNSSDESPTGHEETSDNGKAPTNTTKASTENEEAPSYTTTASTENEEEPSYTTTASTENEEEPSYTTTASTENEEAPTDSEKATTAHEETSADETDPTDDEETPTDDEETPTDDEEMPTDDDETPTDDQEVPWDRLDTTGDQDLPFDEDDTDDWRNYDDSYDGNLPDDEFDGALYDSDDGAAVSSLSRRERPGRTKRHEESAVEMCVVGVISTEPTGVIADIDGDGRLDYISLAIKQYDLVNTKYDNFTSHILETIMYKVSLETRYMDGTFQHRHVDAKTSLKSASSASTATGKAGNVFLHPKDQKWAHYFPNNEVYS